MEFHKMTGFALMAVKLRQERETNFWNQERERLKELVSQRENRNNVSYKLILLLIQLDNLKDEQNRIEKLEETEKELDTTFRQSVLGLLGIVPLSGNFGVYVKLNKNKHKLYKHDINILKFRLKLKQDDFELNFERLRKRCGYTKWSRERIINELIEVKDFLFSLER